MLFDQEQTPDHNHDNNLERMLSNLNSTSGRTTSKNSFIFWPGRFGRIWVRDRPQLWMTMSCRGTVKMMMMVAITMMMLAVIKVIMLVVVTMMMMLGIKIVILLAITMIMLSVIKMILLVGIKMIMLVAITPIMVVVI